MKLGLLTARFDADRTLESIIDFAAKAGFDCLEIAVGRHLSPGEILTGAGAADLKAKLDAAGLTISSLAAYSPSINSPDPDVRAAQAEAMTKALDAAEALGVDVVCVLAGMPLPGKTKMETIEEDLPGVFAPILADAARRGIKIALENWFATNIQHLDHFRRLFELLPDENFGLNFDPSHLLWQGIDYMAAVDEFADRIFHTHAKDTAIDDAALRRVGVLDGSWWRYTIPGTGRVAWGEYFGKLRDIGFDGAVSIEHEDRTFDAEEGFIKGAAFLRGYIG